VAEENVVDANTEGKETPEAQDFDTIADKVLDDFEGSSTSKEGAEGDEENAGGTGPDQSKKGTEGDKPTSSVEEKLAKIREILGNDDKAVEAYIKSKGYHTDPAWQKLLEKSKTPAIPEETQKELEEFKKVTSSREYIETKMKAAGYKQEAIDDELKRRGFEVKGSEQDDVALVASKLGLNMDGVDDNTKAIIGDVAKIVDVIFKDRIAKLLPETLKPIEENLKTIRQKENASEITNRMRGVVSNEGVLDFDKDVTPAVAKWLNDNPEATQEDVFDAFLEINHRLSVERLKTGNKRADNANNKRSLPKSFSPSTGKINVQKTGDFNKDADSILDALGVS